MAMGYEDGIGSSNAATSDINAQDPFRSNTAPEKRERERDMGSHSSEPEIESPISISNLSPSVFPAAKKKRQRLRTEPPPPPPPPEEVEEEEEGEVILYEGRAGREEAWPRKSGEVMLEGYVEAADAGGEEGSEGFGRTKSLTDEDLEELKGCLDLGFGFSYEEIPELCNTLPALELCYSMSQRFLDEQQQQQHRAPDGAEEAVEQCAAVSSLPIANWRISEPGDHPEEVKARLKYWAQAVACTVRLCSCQDLHT